MPSIYPQLKKSDRKHIANEKARIRKQFLDVTKQEEMIDALYKKMLGNTVVAPTTEKPKTEKAEAPKATASGESKEKAKAEPKGKAKKSQKLVKAKR